MSDTVTVETKISWVPPIGPSHDFNMLIGRVNEVALFDISWYTAEPLNVRLRMWAGTPSQGELPFESVEDAMTRAGVVLKTWLEGMLN